jgi:hypothetical protein
VLGWQLEHRIAALSAPIRLRLFAEPLYTRRLIEASLATSSDLFAAALQHLRAGDEAMRRRLMPKPRVGRSISGEQTCSHRVGIEGKA